MSHHIQALVYRRGMAKRVLGDTEYPRIQMSQGFEMLPQKEEIEDDLATRFSGSPTHSSGKKPVLDYLWRDFAALACAISQHTPVAYVETMYFGGFGEQSAIVWDRGAVVLGPLTTSTEDASWSPSPESRPHWAINEALRLLGVKRKGRGDEFAGLGLEEHRSTEG
jgi:hypothetical protein